jgi:hypothetical protein
MLRSPAGLMAGRLDGWPFCGNAQYQAPETLSLVLRTPKSNLARRKVVMQTPSR